MIIALSFDLIDLKFIKLVFIFEFFQVSPEGLSFLSNLTNIFGQI
jgi:hypothetical protein